jgi:carboxylesterase type B
MAFILSCLTALSVVSLVACQGTPSVQTTSGKITGMSSAKVATVSQFLGIPFALAPTGPRRWLKPQDYNSTREIRAIKQAAY